MAEKSSSSLRDKTNKKVKECIPVKTDLIRPNDSIVSIAEKYVKPHLENGDIVVCSEKAVAFSQGRVIAENEVSAGLLARILSRFVMNSPYGIGMRDPRTMQVAINMAGSLRITVAAIIGGLGKLIGRSGDFYRIAGMEVSMIDGVVEHRFKELRRYIIPPPEKPDQAAQKLSEALDGSSVVIMDVNDLGGSMVIGQSHDDLPVTEIEDFMRHDNPLGQGTQQTPMGILR